MYVLCIVRNGTKKTCQKLPVTQRGTASRQEPAWSDPRRLRLLLAAAAQL